MTDESPPPKVRYAWGGARPGAGRPRKIPYDAQKEYKRSKNKMPAEVKARLGPHASPIDVMQALMIWHISCERWEEALRIAGKLAPYTNAKVGPTDPSEGRPLPLSLNSLSDAQLDAFILRLQASIARGVSSGIIEGTAGISQEPELELKPKVQ